jgi:ribosomal protein S18 acetylase RimI-like enzyme
MDYDIRVADLTRAWDRAALIAVLDGYARDPMGGAAALTPDVIASLPDKLAAVATARLWLAAGAADEPAGVAVCFLGFSTFLAKPLLNLHDLAVAPAHRGRGLGRRLLDTVTEAARALGCGAVTLEVRDDNAVAQRLYRSAGFGANQAPHRFLVKRF